MAPIPEKYHDLVAFDTKAFAHFVTLMADGTPQVTPVWFDYDSERFLVNTARGRVKDRNMSRNPHVAFAISDPQNPYRYLQVRGRVVASTEEGADASIDRLALKYLGAASYPFRTPTEKRVLYTIEPVSIQAQG